MGSLPNYLMILEHLNSPFMTWPTVKGFIHTKNNKTGQNLSVTESPQLQSVDVKDKLTYNCRKKPSTAGNLYEAINQSVLC